jgi:hypothetical protein
LFDQVIETGRGQLLGIKFPPSKEIVHVVQESQKIKIDQFHSLLGHPNEQIV